MINSHKEFIDEIRLFVDKMDLINSFVYLKDAERIQEEALNAEPRTLVLGLTRMEVDFENYNNVVTYNFILAEETVYEEDAILNAETENMFCISALADYLNFISEADISLTNINYITESIDKENSYTTVTGSFDFIIKRTASYWKQMETFSQ